MDDAGGREPQHQEGHVIPRRGTWDADLRPDGWDRYRGILDPPRLLDDDDLDALPDPTWLVPGIIPDRSRVGLYGPPGLGKTFTALNLALAIGSRDGTWLGHEVHHGSVVYIAAEGASGLKLRVRAWKRHQNLPDRTDVRYWPQVVNLLGSGDLFVRKVREVLDNSVVLVIIDTLARCMEGGDENSSRDMGLAIAGVEHIVRALECTVMLVHHPGKKQGSLERGHGALRCAALRKH